MIYDGRKAEVLNRYSGFLGEHEGDHRGGIDLCLVHGGNTTIQTIEGAQFQITAEGFGG